jgi:hypothetical protein
MALSCSPETTVTAFQCWKISIVNFSYILFEQRICLNNNLKKCHDLGHLSFSLNGANQINISKIDKCYLKMLQSLVIIYQLFL